MENNQPDFQKKCVRIQVRIYQAEDPGLFDELSKIADGRSRARVLKKILRSGVENSQKLTNTYAHSILGTSTSNASDSSEGESVSNVNNNSLLSIAFAPPASLGSHSNEK